MVPLSASTTEVDTSTYELVAHEYYDATRHPTCANFREATRMSLRKWLKVEHSGEASYVEVGAGRSVLIEELEKAHQPPKGVLLADSSPTMLRYSVPLQQSGVNFLLGDATNLGVTSSSIDRLVSSLGDPYNTSAFWKEVYRVLRPGGLVFYSAPSYEWAVAFRSWGSQIWNAAEFVLGDGRRVLLPSFVLPVEDEIALIEGSGLRVNSVEEVAISDLGNQYLSPKLMLKRGVKGSVITSYAARKG